MQKHTKYVPDYFIQYGKYTLPYCNSLSKLYVYDYIVVICLSILMLIYVDDIVHHLKDLTLNPYSLNLEPYSYH